jgi:hypothetical protein
LIVTDWLAVPPALVAVQVRVVPVVSVVIVVGPHPEVDVIDDSGSLTVQVTVTLETYQPFAPRVPLTAGVMTGGVASDGGHGLVDPLTMVLTLFCAPCAVLKASTWT